MHLLYRCRVGGWGTGTRCGRALLAGLSAVLLAGCTSTVVGVARKAHTPAESDSAIVALMDTGNYPTRARQPYGTAGSRAAGLILEANRMAEFVVGPWQVDAMLRYRDPFRTAPMSSVDYLHMTLGFLKKGSGGQNLDEIGAKHGYITGFSSARNPRTYPLDEYVDGGWSGLSNAVMRFPDADSAAAAAAEMGAAPNPPPLGYGPGRPVNVDDHPESVASAFTNDDESSAVVASFTAHGPYVLYEQARADRDSHYGAVGKARGLVSDTVRDQLAEIDRFVPTEPAKLADLPEDPSGWLLARTIFPLDRKDSPAGEGVWKPTSWLQFEDDPVDAAPLFTKAGVDMVAQGSTTVYQARDAAGAALVADRFTADTRAQPDVKPISAPPGFPSARCFERTWGAAPADAPLPLQQAVWQFKCVARADRYAFTAFSAQEKDVKQQISAQYRILAGK